MADQPVRWTPLGNLDKDTEYKLVGKGNYTDALDVIKQDDDGQVSGTIQPTKRNKHAFSLGEVQAQNKKYRVTVSGDATKSHALRFLSTKRDYRITTGAGPNGEVVFDGTIASLQSAFNASNLPGAFQVSVSGNTMEFELVPYPYYQWYLESVGDDDVEIVCIQEAIPTDLAGPLKDIGSYDLLGDLFIFSTTQDNEPTELDVQIAGVGPISPNPSPPPPNAYTGPLTQLFFNGPHGLQEGQWISITESSANWLNGLFVVQDVLTPTDVNIVTDTAWGASHPAVSVGSPKVFIHPVGIGEIGVAQKNNSNNPWNYTRLIRSVELNFITKKNIQAYAEVDFRRRSVYYTDNYNRPRVFYYYGDYQEDGAFIEPNIYEYGSVGVESSLQLTSSSDSVTYVDFVDQIDNGGNLLPGIKYYCVRPLTENGDAGPISPLTPPIIVYNQDNNVDGVTYSHEIAGVKNDVNTERKNVIRVYGLNSDVYSNADIICLESVDGVLTAGVIHNFSITGSPFYEYTHTGFEEIEITVDVGEIAATSAFTQSSIVRAKNISEIDARNVLSNVSTVSDIDLSEWASSIRHELFYDSYSEATLKDVGEFQDSFVMEDNLGLMLNETYRFGVRLHLKGYGWTDWYWVDDIKIDANSINEANSFDNRRDSGLPDYNLSSGFISPLQDFENDAGSRAYDSNTNEYVGTYCVNLGGPPTGRMSWLKYFDLSDNKYTPTALYKSPKVRFNIQWDFYRGAILENLQDIVSGVEFGIGDIENSVKASGYGVLGVSSNDTYNDDKIYEFPFHPENTVSLTTPNHFTALLPNYPYVTDSPSGGGGANLADEKRNYVSFYSPEHVIEGDGILSSASRLISIGSALTYKFLPGAGVASPNDIFGYYSLFHPQGFDNTQSVIDIDESAFISDQAQEVTFSNGDTYIRRDCADVANPDMDQSFNADLYPTRFRRNNLAVFKLGSDIPQYQETEIRKQHRGVIYCQIYNDESPNYPSKEETNYRKIGKTISFQGIPLPTIEVDGGDTATSLFYFKQRSLYYFNPEIPFNGVAQEGSVLGLVCQTRINVKALNPFENEPTKALYPFGYYGSFNFANSSAERAAISLWRAAPTIDSPVVQPQRPANNIYEKVTDYEWNDNASVIYYPSFNDLGIGIGGINEKPTRIFWSERKIPNSLVDYYRLILPISYKDLSLSYGEINHHENINGELFTIQPRKFQLQYFNTRGTLQGSNEGVEVLIGDASVLSRDGQTLSSYGTSHKWSVVKGSSSGGKDVIYWFNQENGLFMRFGADGTVVISERHGMRSFSANNTKWTENQYAPALNYGIRSVWDDRFKEAIWTFIGLRGSQGEWGTLPSNQLYAEGDTVTNNTFINYPFDGVPDVYVSLSLHAPIPQSEPGVGNDWETYWRRVDRDDPEYYSVFTLAFNELSNGFSTFYSHLPKTYLKWKNKFLSSHPTERSEIYEHRYGYDKWYEYDGVWKESEPFLEGVVNPFPDQSKKFVAIQALSDNVPDRIELITKDHESFLVSADFDPEDDAWRSPVKNDILTSLTGNPNDDTESLVGAYMRIKFKFFNGAYNKLNNLIVKVRQRLRKTQS